jgi:hypothetical protein
MLAGSRVKVTIRANLAGTSSYFCVLKGVSQFEEWKSGGDECTSIFLFY